MKRRLVIAVGAAGPAAAIAGLLSGRASQQIGLHLGEVTLSFTKRKPA